MNLLESQGVYADLEVVLKGMRLELYGLTLEDFARDRGVDALNDGIIRRPGIGQVLGVR